MRLVLDHLSPFKLGAQELSTIIFYITIFFYQPFQFTVIYLFNNILFVVVFFFWGFFFPQ